MCAENKEVTWLRRRRMKRRRRRRKKRRGMEVASRERETEKLAGGKEQKERTNEATLANQDLIALIFFLIWLSFFYTHASFTF